MGYVWCLSPESSGRFSNSKKRVCKLSINETTRDTEYSFIWNDVGLRVKRKWKFNEKAMFCVSLENLGLYNGL